MDIAPTVLEETLTINIRIDNPKPNLQPPVVVDVNINPLVDVPNVPSVVEEHPLRIAIIVV